MKQSLSNSRNNVISPLTDISSAEGLDDSPVISQNTLSHSQQQQQQQQQLQQKTNYNPAAIAAKAAVRNVSGNTTISPVKRTLTQTSAYRTPAATSSSGMTSIPRVTQAPDNGTPSSQSSPRSDQKKGFFKRIFSRSKSTKIPSPTEKNSPSSSPPKDSKFSLRRISLIRSSSRNSVDRSQCTSRASSIDVRGLSKSSNSSRSSLAVPSKMNTNGSNNDVNKELSTDYIGPLNLNNSTQSNIGSMRIFTPVAEATEANSSYNTLSNTDLPLSNRTISDFNSGENENYNYLAELKDPLVSHNTESAKHSLVGVKSNDGSFYSANEDLKNASNRITEEKSEPHQLQKVKTAETSDLSETDDFDTSMASISKIDSSIVKKSGHDRVAIELGYLSTVVGLGETSFFNSGLKKTNTNRSVATNATSATSATSATNATNNTHVTNSTGMSNTEKDENGVLKLSIPSSDSRSSDRKSAWGSIKTKDERKRLANKLGRKIPFAKLRERFDISFDDDAASHSTGHESDAESASYVNKSILDDDTDFDLHSALSYDNEFFHNLKTKHILPADHEPKHVQIRADMLKSCMKDEEDISNLFHQKGVDVGFIDDVQYGVTFSNDIYDRSNPDMKKVYLMMTYYPREIRAIRIELNEFKKNEMVVNEASKQYTHTFQV